MADQQLRLIASVIDRASGPLRAIAGRLRAMAGSNYGQRIANSFRGATAAASKLGAALQGAVVGGLGAVGIGAISAGAALAGFLNMLTQSRDRLDALDEQAGQTGFSLQQLRELQFVSSRGGVDWETMSSGLLQMSKRVGELKTGTGGFGKELAKVSPALYRQLKASKTNTQAFSILHKAMSRIQDPAKRIAFAMKAFGKPGAEIAKMGMSTEDFLAQMERARKFKGILPEDAGQRMGAANDAVDDLKDAFEGLTDLVSYETAPAFTNIVNRIAEFMAVNREAIASGFREFLQDVGGYLKTINWPSVIEGAKSFGRSIATTVEALGGLKNTLIALSVVAIAPMAVGVFQAASAVLAFGAAIIGVPVGVLAAIAAAGVAIYRDWENVSAALSQVGEAFREVFNAGSFSQFVTAMNNLGTSVNNVGLAIRNALLKGVLDVIQLVFGEGARSHVEGFLAFLDSIPARIGTALSGVGASISGAWADVEARWSEGTARIRTAVMDFAGWLATAAMDAIRNAVSGIADAIAAPFRKAAEYISSLRASGAFTSTVTPPHVTQGLSRGGPIPVKPPGASVPSVTPSTPGQQSSLIGRATRVGALGGGGARQVAMTGGATVDLNIRSSDGLKVASTASRSSGLISRVNLNRGPSMATG